MTAEIVNPVDVEHVEPWLRQLGSTLLDNTYADAFSLRVRGRQRIWVPERSWGVRDRGRWVATLATYPRVLSVPGPSGGTATTDLAVDALTGVSVAATHRRRGLLTAMIGQSLAAAKERGDAIGILVAAEWPIYGRFGYAPATQVAGHRLHPRRRGAVIDGADPTTVHQVDPDEAGPVADAVFDLARRRRAGQVDRPAPWWDRRVGRDGYERSTDALWFVHNGPDGPDGVLAWKVSRESDFQTYGAVEVDEFVAANDRAERDLWGYLGGLDIIEQIDLWPRPVDDAAAFLLADGRSLHQTEVHDLLWLRLLNVPAALSSRSYATDGDLVLDVRDPTPGGYAQGRVRLTASDGVTTCEPTDREPDLCLDQRTLASAYLGGFRLRALALARTIDEITPGALGHFDLMLSTPLAPFTQTTF